MEKFLRIVFILHMLAFPALAKIRVVTTIWPLTLLVKDVGGEYVEVETLLPPGVSIHVWEMRPRDILRIHRADLLVMVGCSAEPWLRFSGAKRLWKLCDGVKLKDGNPHVWLSFRVMEKKALDLAEVLGSIDKAHAQVYRERALELEERLRRLRSSFRAPTDTRVVSHHGAWVYLFPELGLYYVGSMEPSPHREPGPKRLMGLIRALSSASCRVVVSEWGHNRKLADLIAERAKACLAVMYPLGTGRERGLVEFFEENLTGLERCVERCIR